MYEATESEDVAEPSEAAVEGSSDGDAGGGEAPATVAALDLPDGEKKCTACNEMLPLINFYAHTPPRRGYHASCKSCENKTNKDKKREKRKLSLEEEGAPGGAASDAPLPASPDALYIMKNMRIPGEIKVGRSIHPEERARELSRGQNFTISVERVYGRKGHLEKLAHGRLKARRVEGAPGTEWFRLSVDEADTIIRGLIVEDEL